MEARNFKKKGQGNKGPNRQPGWCNQGLYEPRTPFSLLGVRARVTVFKQDLLEPSESAAAAATAGATAGATAAATAVVVVAWTADWTQHHERCSHK